MAAIRFLIIGAQKAGTTSLFEYMRRHPQIHMPRQKEMAFFSTERYYRQGAPRYVKQVLLGAAPNAACGEASVAYMGGTPFSGLSQNESPDLSHTALPDEPLEDVVPQRIKLLLPDVKLLCVLRDPVERAYSHYRMAVLDKAESRTFAQAVDELLEPSALRQARVTPTIANSYIVNGEYHRVLSGFLRTFPREQLKVLFASELFERPRDVLRDVFRFIDVDADFVPDNLSTRYRLAATERRIAGLDLYAVQASLARARPTRAIWHSMPAVVREHLDRAFGIASFRVELWNAWREGPDNGETVAPEVRRQLAAHFRQDSEALATTLETAIPWLKTWPRPVAQRAR
jgi:hypothetical protein